MPCDEDFLFSKPISLSATAATMVLFFEGLSSFLFSVKFYFLSVWENSSEKPIPSILCQMKKIWKGHTPTLKGTLSLFHGYGRPPKIPMLKAIRTP